MLTDDDKETLARNGWSLDCESPLEISHGNGSTATGDAVAMVIAFYQAYGDDEEEGF